MALIKINNRSSVDTVLKGRRNYARNGAMMIHQRGDRTAEGSGSTKRMLDGYQGIAAGVNPLMDLTQEEDAPTGSGLRYSLKWEVDTADTIDTGAEEYFGFTSNLELQQHRHLYDEDYVTVSFWIKSNVTGTYSFVYQHDQTASVLTSDPRISYVAEYTINSSGTWEYKTITIPVKDAPYGISSTDDNYRGAMLTWIIAATSNRTGKNTGWLSVDTVPTTNASYDYRNAITSTDGNRTEFTETVGNYIQITGVQFEAGDVASTFEHRSYTDELMDAYRYCYRINQQNAGSTVSGIGTGLIPNSTDARLSIMSPVPMRGTSITKSASSTSDFEIDVEATSITEITNINYLGSEGNNQIHNFEWQKSSAYGSYLGDAFILEFADSASGGSLSGWLQIESEM